MKKIILASLPFIFLSVVCFSQSIENQVISSAGDVFSTEKGTIEWTMGETIVGSLEIQDKMLTSGFHQPYLIDCDVKFETEVNCVGNDEFIVTFQSNDNRQMLVQYGNESFEGKIDEGFVAGPFANGAVVNGNIQLKDQAVCNQTFTVDNIDCQKNNFQLLSFDGQVAEKGNVLECLTFGNLENGKMILSKSTDGESYTSLRNFAPNEDNKVFIDENPKIGINYYKITVLDSDGNQKDVKEVALTRVEQFAEEKYVIETYPNPVVSDLTVYLQDYDKDEVVVSLYSTTGTAIMSQKIAVTDNKVVLNMRDLNNTVYLVSLITPEGKLITTQKIQKMD